MRNSAIGMLLGLIIVICVAAMAGVSQVPGKEKIRIGVYDNRAIAIAYAASEFNPVREKMKELDAAKSAGDTKRISELEAWGPQHQAKLHKQGFGRFPVDDLLEPVKDAFSDVAQQARVHAIAWRFDYASDDVEIVDVTESLVMLYTPSERTLKMTRDIVQREPVDLETLEELDDR